MHKARVPGPMEHSLWIIHGRVTRDHRLEPELWVRVTRYEAGEPILGPFQHAHFVGGRDLNVNVEDDERDSDGEPDPKRRATGARRDPATGDPAGPSTTGPRHSRAARASRPKVASRDPGGRPSSPDPGGPLPAADLAMRQIRPYTGDTHVTPLDETQRARLPTGPLLNYPGFRPGLPPSDETAEAATTGGDGSGPRRSARKKAAPKAT